MPSARIDEFRRAAAKLGFERSRQVGSHERWIHPDGRGVTLPVHGAQEIGDPLFHRILKQLGITLAEFQRLR